jgi:hypothetical protein
MVWNEVVEIYEIIATNEIGTTIRAQAVLPSNDGILHGLSKIEFSLRQYLLPADRRYCYETSIDHAGDISNTDD